MKIIIVGGVAGGASAAARMRRNDESAEIILIEKGDHISFANCGLPYYIGGVIDEESKLLLQTPESFNRRFNVDVRVGHECISVSPASKTITIKEADTGSAYEEQYDKLILSPGASPVVPDIQGIESGRVFTLRNIPDTFAIKKHLDTAAPKSCAVIGGGFIGLEVAENLKIAGLDVNVIEFGDHVIGPLDADIAYDLQNYIRGKGIHIHLNSEAVEITPNSIRTRNGETIPADMVIVSVGVKPATSFLVGSGIALGKRGEIIVNEFMETSVKGVYAVGDAVASKNIVSNSMGVVPLASPANKQGVIAADNISGIPHKYTGSQGTAIVKMFEMAVAVTGLSEKQLIDAETPYLKSITYSASHAGYYPGGQMMAVKLLFAKISGKLLGAQVCGGEGVDKRIDVLASAIRAGMNVIDLQDLELAYAPPFASAKDPVNMAGYVAGNILSGKSTPMYIEDLEHFKGALIDVRTPQEFESGTIPGAVNIPLDDIRARIGEINALRPIGIFCQIGLRGYVAERILKQKGYNAANLIGGYRLYAASQK